MIESRLITKVITFGRRNDTLISGIRGQYDPSEMAIWRGRLSACVALRNGDWRGCVTKNPSPRGFCYLHGSHAQVNPASYRGQKDCPTIFPP